MASWKYISKKAEQAPVDKPKTADWESMLGKIEAHPDLGAPVKKRANYWWRGAGLMIVALLGLGIFWLWPEGDNPGSEEISTPTKLDENQSNRGSVRDANTSFSEPEVRDDQQLQTQAPEASEPAMSTTAGNLKDERVEAAGDSNTQQSVRSDVGKVAGNFSVPDKEGQPRMQTGQTAPDLKSTQFTEGLSRTETEQDNARAEMGKITSLSGKTTEEPGEDVPEETTTSLSDSESDAAFKKTSTEEVAGSSTPKSEPLDFPPPGDQVLNLKGIGSGELVALTPELAEVQLPLEEPQQSSMLALEITGINFSGNYLTDFETKFQGAGLGIDLDLQKENWLFTSGLHFSTRADGVENLIGYNYDTTYTTRTQLVWQVITDSTWVVTGPYTGTYLHDTLYLSRYDSITQVELDSSEITSTNTYSYLEVPLLAGYRFGFGRVAVDVLGGAYLSYSKLQNPSELMREESQFGWSLALQPAIRYYLRPDFSVFGRSGLRYRISDPHYKSTEKLYYQFQLGLTYHW